MKDRAVALPPDPLPAGCNFDSSSDSDSVKEYVEIMKECWKCHTVRVFYAPRFSDHGLTRPFSPDVAHARTCRSGR